NASATARLRSPRLAVITFMRYPACRGAPAPARLDTQAAGHRTSKTVDRYERDSAPSDPLSFPDGQPANLVPADIRISMWTLGCATGRRGSLLAAAALDELEAE